jgi:hypothetical protein
MLVGITTALQQSQQQLPCGSSFSQQIHAKPINSSNAKIPVCVFSPQLTSEQSNCFETHLSATKGMVDFCMCSQRKLIQQLPQLTSPIYASAQYGCITETACSVSAAVLPSPSLLLLLLLLLLL